MATPLRRTDTRDVTALLSAVDEKGQYDPLTFEAQRLILRNQRVGGVDAAALVNDLQRAPGYRHFNRDSFLDAIDSRLETPAEKRRFAEALDAANITDSWQERIAEQAQERTAELVRAGEELVKRLDKATSDGLSVAKQWANESANDPNASTAERAAAAAASKLASEVQFGYGATKGAVVHTGEMLGGFIDLAKMGEQMATDENYRKIVFGMAKMYAADVIADPSKPGNDISQAVGDAIDKWKAGYESARQQGKVDEYVGGTAGAAAVEIVSLAVPPAKLGKFAKALHAIDAVVPEHAASLTHALGEVTPSGVQVHVVGKAGDLAKGARALGDDAGRVAHSAEAIHALGETLADVNRGLKKGGQLAEGADDIAEGLIGRAREHGKLEGIVKAAHATGNVQGLLRSGHLSPKDLTEVLKMDKTVFDGEIKFEEALKQSTEGITKAQGVTHLSELTPRKLLGDIAEAIQTYKMVEDGYTDIVTIKNNSGHGIDIVGRNKGGDLEFFEVKSSAKGIAVAQHGDPAQFIASRLDSAVEGLEKWAAHNQMPGTQELAAKLRGEITSPDGTVSVNAKWVQMNMSLEPGTGKILFDRKVEDWVVPGPRHTGQAPALERFQDHAEFQQIHKAVLADGRGNEEQCANVTAALLRSYTADPLMKRIDSVAFGNAPTGETNVFAVYSPHGDKGPHFHVHVNAQQAAQEPAEKNLTQVEQINQQQAIAQQEALQRGPDDPGRGGPRMG
ncbi:XVIPCD domain-containing protein [Lysobacter sp. CA199]|uniref:XVIPCD domain-containing protein n=1 Tax=Lysobacter sp. CA199 TaxID=3455608 RepID=UPI003F8D0ADA